MIKKKKKIQSDNAQVAKLSSQAGNFFSFFFFNSACIIKQSHGSTPETIANVWNLASVENLNPRS